jgi:DNA primase
MMSAVFSDRDIEEIRNRVNLVDFVSEYASLKRSGRRFRALCPFHSEKTPSFYVDPDKQLYHCFGCGAGGDIFTFVMEMEKLTFPEAVEYLAQKAGVTLARVSSKTDRSEKEIVYRLLEYAAKLFQVVLFKTEEGKKALNYLLEERGISTVSIKQFEIGFSPTDENAITKKLLKEGFKEKQLIEAGLSIRTSRGLIDRFRGRIMFPIKDIKDRVVGFGGRQFLSDEPKYLNTPETAYFKKGSLLYNLNRAKHHAASEDRILIVEGYTDVIALHEAGIPYAVATLGTALTETHFSVISRFTKNVYLAFDADSAGRKAAERGLELISSGGSLNARVILFPEGKDPADFCRELDKKTAKEKIEKMLDESVSLEDFVIKRRISGFNLLDPKEKSQAAAEAARVISAIQDPVVRDEYVRKYSSRLGLSVDSFMTKVNKL